MRPLAKKDVARLVACSIRMVERLLASGFGVGLSIVVFVVTAGMTILYRPSHQLAAASFMILTIVASTSCATPLSWGVLNIASRVVGFKVARMVLPPSS